MRLTELRLTNFRSFADTVFDLNADRILLGGVNGSGKSTCREAIKYALLGRCQGVDGKGAGAGVLSPTFTGQPGVAVTATIEGIGGVARTWTPLGSSLDVHGFTGNPSAQQEALYEKLKTTDACLAAVLDSGTFLRLHHADAKALVLALLNVTITVGDKPYTLDELDAAYAANFKARTTAKAVLKNHLVPILPEGTYPDVATIEATLKERRASLEERTRAVGASGGRRSVLEAKLAEAKQRRHVGDLATVEGQIADLEERLGIMEDETAPAVVVEPAKGDPERLTFLTGRIAALEAHKPTKGCVLDSDVPCDTHRNKFKARVKALQVEAEGLLAAGIAVANPHLSETGAVSPLTLIRRQLDRLKEQRRVITDAQAFNQRQADEEAALTAQLASLGDSPAPDAEIADLRARIEKGEGILKAARTHQEALERYHKAEETRTHLQAEVDRLEALVAVLGPTGARVPALAAKLGPFEAAVNAGTQPFGWVIQFLLEPWAVIANGRPVETYSRSEQYRIGIAIQLAIARLSGLSFAIVDELDMLDQEARAISFKMLYQCDVDQILILSTRETVVPLPLIEGCLSYRVGKTEGRSAIIERVPA